MNLNFYGSVNIYEVVIMLIMLINSRSYFIYNYFSLFYLPSFAFHCECFVSTPNVNRKIMSKDSVYYSHVDVKHRVILKIQTDGNGLTSHFCLPQFLSVY
jgi:hypothetical protein